MVARRLRELHHVIRDQGGSLEAKRKRAAMAIARSQQAMARSQMVRSVVAVTSAGTGLAVPEWAAVARTLALARLARAQAGRLREAVMEARRTRAACAATRTGLACVEKGDGSRKGTVEKGDGTECHPLRFKCLKIKELRRQPPGLNCSYIFIYLVICGLFQGPNTFLQNDYNM
jgi:hypothetical protein